MTFDSYEDDQAMLKAHERRIKRCSSCNAKIIWFKTAAGNWMPVDADTVEPEDVALELPRHISHFASCPNHAQHRRKR